MTPTTAHLRFVRDNCENHTDQEIADMLGVSYNFVFGLRRRYGIRKDQRTWQLIGVEKAKLINTKKI